MYTMDCLCCFPGSGCFCSKKCSENDLLEKPEVYHGDSQRARSASTSNLLASKLSQLCSAALGSVTQTAASIKGGSPFSALTPTTKTDPRVVGGMGFQGKTMGEGSDLPKDDGFESSSQREDLGSQEKARRGSRDLCEDRESEGGGGRREGEGKGVEEEVEESQEAISSQDSQNGTNSEFLKPQMVGDDGTFSGGGEEKGWGEGAAGKGQITSETGREGGEGVRIGNIVYLPVEENQQGEMVVCDTSSVFPPESSESSGEKTSTKTKPPPLSLLGVDATDGSSTPALVDGVRSRASSEVFSPLRTSAQHLSNFVNYATGFFRSSTDDRASVKDVRDIPGLLERSSVTPGVKSSGVGGQECRFRSAVRAEERPELFRSISEGDLLAPQEDVHKQPALYLHLRVDTEECDRRVSASTPCEAHRHQSTKPHYWFSVPRNKGDHLYAFFIHWRPDLYGDDDINPEDRGFVVVDRVDVTENGGSLPFMDDHFGQQLSSSFKKDWEIVSREELRRRTSIILDLDQVIMPEMSAESTIMAEEHVLELAGKLPPRTVGYRWSLKYSTGLHGFSLKRLYRELCQLDSPILLVLQDTDDVVFGAYLSDPPRLSDHFYGTGTCQLWTFRDRLQVFEGCAGDNHYFIKGDDNSLSIGASHGSYGLWLDGDLYHGHSSPCSTFHNCSLSGKEDFIIKALEAWAFLTC